jgi:cell division septation protein DedD
MGDDEFHEIRYSLKQLVFLFMSAAVVLIVVFLFGVLVGRGVGADSRFAAADGGAIALAVSPQGQIDPPAAAGQVQTQPVAPDEELSYHQRLESEPPPETLKQAAPAASKRQTFESPPVTPAPAPASPAPASVGGEPAGSGFAVQVAALNERTEAEAMLARLIAKGYQAYIVVPPPGSAAAVYRVRIGKFGTRRQAEEISRRLEKEEQFKPWIIR